MIGVVCLHGLGGTPHSVLPITAAVHDAGYAVVAPMLPGHGTVPSDLDPCTWDDWLDAVDLTVTELSARCHGVALVGQSMGGSLALQVAARRADVVGVAAINALVSPADPDAVEHMEHLVERGRTMQPAGEPDLCDPDGHDSAYAELPLRSLLQLAIGGGLVHDLLPRITVPVFVASSDHDGVVDPANSELLAASVTGPVTRVRLANSAHVAALDLDRSLLCRELLTWLADLTDGSAAPA